MSCMISVDAQGGENFRLFIYFFVLFFEGVWSWLATPGSLVLPLVFFSLYFFKVTFLLIDSL